MNAREIPFVTGFMLVELLIAVAITPVPMALVRNSRSPTLAAALVQMRAGSTSPVTA